MLQLQPRYVSVRDAANRYATSKSTIYVLLAQNKIRAVKFGGRTLVHVESADQYFDSLPEVQLGRRKVPSATSPCRRSIQHGIIGK
jgi:excisionase family DNA binding protein